MRVKTLIEALSHFDGEAEVVFSNEVSGTVSMKNRHVVIGTEYNTVYCPTDEEIKLKVLESDDWDSLVYWLASNGCTVERLAELVDGCTARLYKRDMGKMKLEWHGEIITVREVIELLPSSVVDEYLNIYLCAGDNLMEVMRG